MGKTRREEAQERLESLRIYASQVEDGERARTMENDDRAMLLAPLLAADAITTALLLIADILDLSWVGREESDEIPLKEGLTAADDLREMLAAEGLTRSGPGPSPEAREQDAGVCASATCPNCGTVGMLYEPWTHPTRWPQGGYRSLAVCPRCPHGQEF